MEEQNNTNKLSDLLKNIDIYNDNNNSETIEQYFYTNCILEY